MRNPEGFPIWYELLTNDAAGSTAFYEAILGWKVSPPRPGDANGYRAFEAKAGLVGGLLELNEKMRSGGAKPTWLFYLAVDDVDATAKKAEVEGGKVLMPAFDIPGVGRVAMLTDPEGIPFYVMRAASEGTSTAFDRTGMGKCNWNELATPDPKSANAFYAKVFGWTYPDKLEMGALGEYVFISAAGATVGATMPQAPGAPCGWQFYFRAPDIDVAVENVKRAGGKVHAGPMDVPGGDRVIVASDVHGVPFGVAAPGKAGSSDRVTSPG